MSLGTVFKSEIRAAARREIKPLADTVRQLRRLVQQLRRTVRRQAAGLRRLEAGREIRRPKKLRLSAERRAQLKLQGAYMGYLRGLTARQKAQVKAARASRGLSHAIGLARRLTRD